MSGPTARGMVLAGWLAASIAVPAASAAETPAGEFVLVAEDDVGGHFYSSVVYAPTAGAVVSWGTRTHSKPIRAHETQHFLPGENRWIDAIPPAMAEKWAGKYKTWPDWNICAPDGEWYQRDGVRMPRPNSSFHQVCWDDHNSRLLFHVGSMTFAYDPAGRTWKELLPRTDPNQPPAGLVWASLCYDPVNRRAVLFGGGGIDAPDGRPHTWTFDVTSDTWRRLELEVEPPARCNAPLVYDARGKRMLLFGGDGQDRGLADTWAFDVTADRWRPRRPPRSPHPRCCHAMAYLSKSGRVLLVGGHPVCEYRRRKQLARQAWIYDPAGDAWTPLAVETPAFHWGTMANLPGTDEVILVTAEKYGHRRKTYRFRWDASIPAADHEGVPPGTAVGRTERTPAWYAAQPPADREAHGEFLASLPANTWVDANVPRSAKARTWGTAIFDTRRGLAMKWGGGHSGYQGTDMAFYHVGANRFRIDRAPAFTPDPFDRWARRPTGRTFFNQPWTRHMRHTCAYDRRLDLGVFADAGGSAFYDRASDAFVKHTWLYDPGARRWLEPLPGQPFPGGGTLSPILIPAPDGVLAYQSVETYGPERLWRFVGEPNRPATWGWKEIPLLGEARPRRHEHMTIVYDARRKRLAALSATPGGRARGERGDGGPRLWFLPLDEPRWRPNDPPAPGGVITREAVYVPDQDAILAYGPAGREDEVWTRAYLCGENRWVPLPTKTPRFRVHEVAMVYDPGHKLAVLLWPPRFEADLRPHLLRLNAAGLK